jgi:hypothetical protein
MKMEQTGCSETLALKLQMPVNNPEESIQHSEYSASLKSRKKEIVRHVLGMQSGHIECSLLSV